MSDKTKIRWTDRTWNPVRGCTIVSPGCKNCFAMGIAARFSGSGRPFEGFAVKRNGHAVWTGKVDVLPQKLREPLTWRMPARVFVNSMSDLFHERVPDEFLDQVFAVMADCPQHTFQILTKRPERMQRYLLERWIRFDDAGLYDQRELPNVWVGVSVEDQRRADERIPVLLGTSAAVRFLSCEPLLAPLDLAQYLAPETARCDACQFEPLDDDCGCSCHTPEPISWIIVGGESGPHYRPMDLDWARSLRDQCVAAGVPYFYKQPAGLRTEMDPHLDGVRWEQYPGQLTPLIREGVS